MDWSWLSFLAEPGFVIPWYAVGALGALGVAWDLRHANTPLKPAMKWAWPIIVLFFSVIGLALYFATARAPGIGRAEGEDEKKRLHEDYEKTMVRRVNGAVIHCVAGDGLGIMTAMVIARALGFSFWQEFWFEYAVGFAFGWFIFQYKSMSMMTDSTARALGMAFRGEFFSMLTVMGGMGAVMTYVTPAVVGAQPGPLTYAFWGFGMFGLLAGYVFTFPMNWMLVKIGWKHGMGSKKDSRPVRSAGAKWGLAGVMTALGLAALVLPAWLTELREGRPLSTAGLPEQGTDAAGGGAPADNALLMLERGLRESLLMAARGLDEGRRHEATAALDAALRVAEVGAQAVHGGALASSVAPVRQARRALQTGDPAGARREIEAALGRLDGAVSAATLTVPYQLPRAFEGTPVLNARGLRIGEVEQVDGHRLRLVLGGHRDVWGFWDLGAGQRVSLPVDAVVPGPRHTLGKSYLMLPTLDLPPLTPEYLARAGAAAG